MNKISPKSIELYIKTLKERGEGVGVIHRKLKSVDKFVDWAHDKGLIKNSLFKQLKQSIADHEAELKQAQLEPTLSEAQDKTSKFKKWLNKLPLSSKVKAQISKPLIKMPQTLGIQHFVGIAFALILMAALGAGVYNQFFRRPETPLAFPTDLTRAGRILSFQGRLTDNLGNPIATATNVQFKLYNVSTGGSSLYATGTCSITPDQDGVFDTLIGGSGYSPTPPQQVCGTQIPENIFSDWPNVYLGVTIGSDSEATPRQQIANVGYAINAETLQGFPPGIQKYNIPYINAEGNVLIATSAAGVRSTWASANFTLSGTGGVTVQSAGATDVALSATESGNITATTGQGTGLFNVLTGNLKVGNGTPGVSLNGEDAYIEGTLEVDGASQFDGGVTFNSTFNCTDCIDFDDIDDTLVLDATTTVDMDTNAADLNFDANTFFIDSSANSVGIGTATPATALDIDSNSNTQSLRLRGTAETTEIANLYVGSSGELIISTTAGADAAQFIELQPEDDNYGLILRESDGTGTATYANFYVVDTTDDYLSINVNSISDGDALVVTAANLVGIGTATPTSKLHVTGAVTGKALAIFDETGDQNILTASASGTTVFNLERAGNAELRSNVTNADRLRLVPYNTGSGTFTGTLTSADITSSDKTWTLPDATGTVCISTGNCGAGGVGADSLDFTEFKDAMTLDASTSIGFGGSTFNFTFTNDGSGNFVVNNSSTGDFVVQDNGTPVFTFNDSGNLDVADDKYIGLGSSAGQIEFDDQSIDEVNILNANVGINTQTPSARLQVAGSGHFSSGADTDVDYDGSTTTHSGFRRTAISDGATLVSAASQNLCTDSLTTPTAVRIDTDTDCTNAGGNNGTYIVGTSATTATTAVTSAWAFNDADTDCNADGTGGDVGCTASNGTYQEGQDLFIDSSPSLVYTSNKVGIGLTTPAAELEVVSTTRDVNRGVTSTQYGDFNLGAQLTTRKARGTVSSPAAVQDGDTIFNFQPQAYDSVNFFSGARIRSFADPSGSAWTSTDHGSYMIFETIQAGTTTITERIRIADTGAITISSLNCTANANGGALTADANGLISCSDDDSGGSTTLQTAYNNGNTIETASNNPVVITETTAATNTGDLLQLTTNVATGGTHSGDALQITLDAVDANGFSGNGIYMVIDQSQMTTGQAVLIEDDAGTDLFVVSENGATTISAASAETTALTITDTDFTNALSIGDNNITGTTANIDLTNFDVVGSSGNTTVGGTLVVTSTSTFNGAATFNTDVDMTFAGTENLAITNDFASTSDINVIDIAVTPSSSAGNKFGLKISQADSANTQGIDRFIELENLDTNLNIADGINFSITANGILTDAIDASSGPITNAINADNNFILLEDTRIFEPNLTDTIVFEDTGGNDLVVITDSGTTGSLTVTGLNCTANANGGALTADANGLIACSDDDSGGSTTLQTAYNSGNTIETASNNPVVITETTAATNTGDLLQLTTNVATGGTHSGDLLQLTIDAVDTNGFTGHGIHMIIDQSQFNTGSAILIEDDAGTNVFTLSENGALALGAVSAETTALTITDTDFTNALSIGDNNITGTTYTLTGTTATIDFTDFDVDADGLVTFASDGAGDQISITTPAADFQALVVDGTTNDSTQTAGMIDLNVDTSTTTAIGGLSLTLTSVADAGNDTLYGNKIDYTVASDASGVDTVYGEYIGITANDANSTTYGLAIVAEDAGGQVATTGLLVENLQATDIDLTDAILVRATTADSIVDGLDVSDAELTNALNVGANFVLFDGIRAFSSSSTVLTVEDTSGNDLIKITDGGTTGSLTVTGLNCTANLNGGALTADANGLIACSDDDSGGGSATLQSAYSAGNTIETASNNPVIITETTAAASTGDLLQLTANPATGGTLSGDALQITMDAVDASGYTGHGIHIIIDQSQSTGNALLIEDDAAAALFKVDENGTLTMAGGQSADITTVAGTAPGALTIQPGNNTTNSGTGKTLTLAGGNESGTTSTGGNVSIDAGTGTTINGTITIGGTNASSLAIGRSGVTTTNSGAFSVSGNTTLGDSNTVDTLTGNLLTSAITSGATTQNAFAVTANSISNGSAFNLTTSVDPTGGSGAYLAQYNFTNANTTSAETIHGLRVGWTQNPASGINGDFEFPLSVILEPTSRASGADVSALLYLNSIENTSSGSTIVDSAILISHTGSPALTTAYNYGLNINTTAVTTDISLQNGETIDNDTNNQINLNLGSSGKLLLTSTTASTIANSAGPLTLDATTYTRVGDTATPTAASGDDDLFVEGDVELDGRLIGSSTVDDETLQSTQTVTVTGATTSYRLTNNIGSAGGGSNITITFNITGLSDTEGGIAFISTQAQKAITASAIRSIVIIQINGNQVSGVQTASQTGADTQREGITLTYAGGAWKVTGQNPGDAADLAEWVPFSGKEPLPGELARIIEVEDLKVERTLKENDKNLAGIISTKPQITLGTPSEQSVRLALTGRVPAVVTSLGGSIKRGDPITSSSVEGTGQKQLESGIIVGKALEEFNPENATCATVNSISEIRWPEDDGSNPEKPCFKVPGESLGIDKDFVYIGKIMVLVSTSFNDPGYLLTSTGDFKIKETGGKEYVYDGTLNNNQETNDNNQTNSNESIFNLVNEKTGEIIRRIGVFAEVVAAKVRTGFIQAENITTKQISAVGAQIGEIFADNIIAKRISTDKIVTPVIETENLTTNVIKPQEKDLTIDLSNQPSPTGSVDQGSDKGELAKLIIKGLDGKTAATIDSEGNATFSGSLAAREATISGTIASAKLETNEASVAGKLTAKEIESQTINELKDRLTSVANENNSQSSQLSNSQTDINEIQSLLAEIRNNPLPDPSTYQNLDNSQTNYLSYGTFGDLTGENLTLTGNANVANLYVLNALAVGNTVIQNDSILTSAWELKLSALNSINLLDGAVIISKDGTLTTKGTLIAQGGVRTNQIKPLTDGGTVNINGAEIDASGSARFNGLSLDKYLEATSEAAIIAAPDNLEKNGLEENAIETEAQSAGIGLIPANNKEIIIYNDSVKKDSLIYVTQTTDKNISLSVTEKESCQLVNSSCRPYFKVTAGTSSLTDTKFNWLIIN